MPSLIAKILARLCGSKLSKEEPAAPAPRVVPVPFQKLHPRRSTSSLYSRATNDPKVPDFGRSQTSIAAEQEKINREIRELGDGSLGDALKQLKVSIRNLNNLNNL
ncbi:MAG: hypothetical protein Q9166_007906 [cf. Caloplaca sp. 2 TL-2023]